MTHKYIVSELGKEGNHQEIQLLQKKQRETVLFFCLQLVLKYQNQIIEYN